MVKKLSKHISKPITRKARHEGTVLPVGCYAPPKGWTHQCGQEGGNPAVVTYKGGKLKRARFLCGERESLPDNVLAALPSRLKWHGTRRNFRVLGQVRRGAFEALAIAMLDEATIIANLTDSVAFTAVHHGLQTPTWRNRMRKRKAKPAALSKTTVLTSTYRDVVRFAWFNRETGKIVKKIKLERM